MATTYNKSLKRNGNGKYQPHVGKRADGTPEKFSLGYDGDEAQRRFELIKALWIESTAGCPEGAGFWTDEHLANAKRIAKGDFTLDKASTDTSLAFGQRLVGYRQIDPTIAADPAAERAAKTSAMLAIRRANGHASMLTGTPVENLVGFTVRQAWDEFTGSFRTNTKQRQPQTTATYVKHCGEIARYLATHAADVLDADVSKFDLATITRMYEVFFARPKTKLGTTMAFDTVDNYCTVISMFVRWIDSQAKFGWRIPRGFDQIRRTPKRTSSDRAKMKSRVQRAMIPNEHLQTLWKNALPIERALMVCGLNMAFGAGECGQLRQAFIKGDYIDGIRFKTGTDSKHYMWAITRDALAWAMKQRDAITIQPEARELVFVTNKGQPMWKYSESGNRCSAVSNIWARLIKRVQKSDASFPAYSFNTLRKTCTARIIQIATPDVASMVLAHGTISEDELLQHYVNTPWEKLFTAQRKLEKKITALFADVVNPWEAKRIPKLPLATHERIKAMHHKGHSTASIAAKLGVGTTTVVMSLKAAGIQLVRNHKALATV